MSKSKFIRAACLAAVMTTFASLPSRAETPTDSITVVTIVDVVSNYAMPQNVERSSALLAALSKDTQHAPGLVSFKVLRDRSRVNHFIILSVWKDKEAFEAYSAADTTRRFRQEFQAGMGGPFDERVYADLN